MNQLLEYGLALVFVNVLLEQSGFPIPAVPTLIVAGALAAEGRIPLPALVAVAAIASVIGDLLWYVAGRRYGVTVLRLLCKVSLSPDTCVRQTESRYVQWGSATLVFGKFVPGISTVAPPLAGAMKIGWARFMFFNTVGILLWVGAAVGIGYAWCEARWFALRRVELPVLPAGAPQLRVLHVTDFHLTPYQRGKQPTWVKIKNRDYSRRDAIEGFRKC